MPVAGQKRKRGQASNKHPYLSGNFAPIQQTLNLTPCTYQGTIPIELAGGEYVRNGGNPVSNEDLGRDAHWFDGDGMLSGVSFKQEQDGTIVPEFVNQYVLTDVYLASISSPHLKSPILPSIATLVNPLASLITVTLRIFRTLILVFLSFLAGSKQAIKKISVANTSIIYHDGRALAACESGPPMRISLPGLETVGWYNGNLAEGEPAIENVIDDQKLGGGGLLGFMREWTTAHPKIDPDTKEMMLFHSSFAPPYVQYSIIPQDQSTSSEKHQPLRKLLNMPVPGIGSAKMMHDFGVSPSHTVIMDLPLSLDPLNLAKNRPVVEYDAMKASRFGVFPRYQPNLVKWFETTACCIFHTANTWDEVDQSGSTKSINMLACRLTSSSMVFSAGNIAAPQPTAQTVKVVTKSMPFFAKYDANVGRALSPVELRKEECDAQSYFALADELESPRIEREPLLRMSPSQNVPLEIGTSPLEEPFEEYTDAEEDQCRLYHYNFSLETSTVAAQFALAAVTFEFPSVRPDREMQEARYIYGCSTSGGSFGAALGRSVKIDVLLKIDSKSLISAGQSMMSKGTLVPVTGCVDTRTLPQIVRSQDSHDPIKAFCMPTGWYAQEPRFVPRQGSTSEDDGYLLTYAFNEAQLDDEDEVPSDDDTARAKSELWIIDAKDMKTVVGKVLLPQRVPYGLHGTWFSQDEIKGQRIVENIRTTAAVLDTKHDTGLWMAVRSSIENWLE